MKHHEDPFFESVRNELYAMEVAPPAGVQAKVMSRVRSGRSAWLLNSVAALLICAAGVGVASWQHTQSSCDAKVSYTNKPSLDAALVTAQARIVDRENSIENDDAFAVDFAPNRLSSVARARSVQAAEPTQLAVLPAVVPVTPEPVCELPKAGEAELNLPKSAELEAAQTVAPAATPAAAPTLSAADILQQANDSSGEVIRMSVKLTVPVDDKE